MVYKSLQFVLIMTLTIVLSSKFINSPDTIASDKPKQTSVPVPNTQKKTIHNPKNNVSIYRNLIYATVENNHLLLDLYIPKTKTGMPPLLVWIHGGGWLSGSKDSCKLSAETKRGYAVASLNYRLSQEAIFPAQIHDCKGAIRWLRANANKYGFNANDIGVMGSSAGGQLASLLGTSNGVTELEGVIGGNLDQSSSIQAVCNFFGATNFHSIKKQRTGIKSKPSSVVTQLFGGTIKEKPKLATLASAVSFIDKTDPAFLIIHGARDKVVPIQQSTSFKNALKEVNVPVNLVILENAGHGGKEFRSKETIQHFQNFFDKHIKGMP